MGNLVFQATLGGQVNLVGPNTASTYNINVPAVAGTMVTTGDTGSVSSTMLASSLSLTTPNINVATGTSLKVTSGFYSTSSSSFTYTDGIVMDYTTGLGRISVGTSDGLAFYNAGVATTELMRLDSSGNLGIGTSSPSKPLEVYNTTESTVWARTTTGYSLLRAGGTGGDFYFGIDNSTGAGFGQGNYSRVIYSTGAYPIVFSTNATERMRIDSSGNVGIGTTPAAWRTAEKALQVNSAASFSGVSTAAKISSNLYVNSSNQTTYLFNGGGGSYLINENSHSWYLAPTGTAGGAATLTQAMTLDSSGNLMVGTTTRGIVNATAFDFDVSNGVGYFSHINGTAGGIPFQQYGYNGSVIGSITQNGTTGVLYNLTSDYRLKNDPQPLTGAKEFVMALQPKKWQWWDGSGEGVGFIAHEFMEVAKYSGNGEKDAVDENGNPVYQSIQPSSSEVMANLVSLLQEQQAIIQQLQADVTALKAPQ